MHEHPELLNRNRPYERTHRRFPLYMVAFDVLVLTLGFAFLTSTAPHWSR